ncbi:MAG TPA: hypothetical protein VKR60_06265 [Candidatus Sulfotelmatobacter sp.]|nr:hypothetical protein [Candidatus Sulfotelmatobacter sp.]
MPDTVVTLPQAGSIALRPELWLALGIAGYSHTLLTRKPLRILSPREVVAEELNAERIEKLHQGLAALADASQMTPTMLVAALEISRATLAPLGVEVSIIGNPQTRRYLLIESKSGMHERKPTESERPRILPAHDYPQGEPGTAAHQRNEDEALQLDTAPQSTGERRTGGIS